MNEELKLEKQAVGRARVAFDMGSAKSGPDGVMLDRLRDLQNRLAAWQGRNFGAQEPFTMALGLSEELSELEEAIDTAAPEASGLFPLRKLRIAVGKVSHAVLKHMQKIRGLADNEVFSTAAGDAAGDIFVYLINFLTILRLDAGTLFLETAERVMKREWKTDSHNGGE